jgi:hypothetical protein
MIRRFFPPYCWEKNLLRRLCETKSCHGHIYIHVPMLNPLLKSHDSKVLLRPIRRYQKGKHNKKSTNSSYFCAYSFSSAFTLVLLTRIIIVNNDNPRLQDFIKVFISQRSLSNGFIYVVGVHFIDKMEEKLILDPSACVSNLQWSFN